MEEPTRNVFDADPKAKQHGWLPIWMECLHCYDCTRWIISSKHDMLDIVGLMLSHCLRRWPVLK